MRALGRAAIALLLGCGGGDPAPAAGEPDGAAGLVYELFFRPESQPAAAGVFEYLELDALEAGHRGRRVQVHGFVTDDPIERRTDGRGHRFVIGQGERRLVVEHEGVLPDRFQPRLEVILTGTLAEDGTRIATDELVAKCPESYDDGTKAPR